MRPNPSPKSKAVASIGLDGLDYLDELDVMDFSILPHQSKQKRAIAP